MKVKMVTEHVEKRWTMETDEGRKFTRYNKNSWWEGTEPIFNYKEFEDAFWEWSLNNE